ncbi:MAG: hypothetical protein DRH33_00005, partial [Candidatus Nealsonbacteria bacterium]
HCNISKANSLLALVREKTNLWQVQFGLEAKKDNIEKAKLYFAIAEMEKPGREKMMLEMAKRIAEILGLNKQKLEERFKKEKFESFGVDLTSGGKCNLKIYTLHQPSKFSEILKNNPFPQEIEDLACFTINRFPVKDLGILHRVSSNSDISSVKMWLRFRPPVEPRDFLFKIKNKLDKNTENWLKKIYEIPGIKKKEIGYLAFENKTLTLYIR